ncbi:hypothetical protein [Candidatus Enterococcus mangumiae]|uniref:Uncharacterized protein n=1 Tax=Candidatus Enterococcus mangumiae TaxID=2230878 RepID=A0ABZ2SZL7_9ENTE|nr:hypothetical protein [Enterococcus sp. DIV1094]MBO0491053.1 hypothetical protein [Enterococcus sp. DIV1094]
MKVSLSLIIDTIAEIVEPDWTQEFEESLITMTRKLIRSGDLYIINKDEINSLEIDQERKDKIYKQISEFTGEMPKDDFDIFVQFRTS